MTTPLLLRVADRRVQCVSPELQGRVEALTEQVEGDSQHHTRRDRRGHTLPVVRELRRDTIERAL
jgi:hypothetical protein